MSTLISEPSAMFDCSNPLGMLRTLNLFDMSDESDTSDVSFDPFSDLSFPDSIFDTQAFQDQSHQPDTALISYRQLNETSSNIVFTLPFTQDDTILPLPAFTPLDNVDDFQFELPPLTSSTENSLVPFTEEHDQAPVALCCDDVAFFLPSERVDDDIFASYEAEQDHSAQASRHSRRLSYTKQRNPSKFLQGPHRPYQCVQCGHAFKRQHDFRRHLLTHLAIQKSDEEFRWKCALCDYSFTRIFALKRHHRRLHKHQTFRCGSKPRPPPKDDTLILHKNN